MEKPHVPLLKAKKLLNKAPKILYLFSGFLFCGTVTEECIMCVGLLFSKNIFTMFAVATKSILSNAVLTMSEK